MLKHVGLRLNWSVATSKKSFHIRLGHIGTLRPGCKSFLSHFITAKFGQLIRDSEILSWYTDPTSKTIVEKYVKETTAAATQKFKDEEIHSYQNWSRNSSLESRYGKERLEKLRDLKIKWDPKGVFTKQLL